MKGILGGSVALLVALFLAYETLAQGEGKGHRGEGKVPRGRPVVDRFAQADTNGDGVITLDEFKAAFDKRLEALKAKMGDKFDPARFEKRAEERFTQLDKDNSGGLTRDEFAAALEQIKHRRRDRQKEGQGGTPADVPATL
jgi:hypothetical protein